MTITQPMVLPPDVMIFAASEVAREVRLRCACGDEDFILTRANSRTPSRVVNRATAELLQGFRQPRTIVEAALSLALAGREDPERTLEAVFGALRPFLQAGWLLPAESPDAKGITATFRPGDSVGGFTILSCVRLIEDTEVYQARAAGGGIAALKVARQSGAAGCEQRFAHEARVLERVGGKPAPVLLAAGSSEGKAYLATTWCDGVFVSQAAAELRQLHAGQEGRMRVLALCGRVVEAFVALHDRGVLHGDIYPNNVLVEASGAVWVIDYGSARILADAEDGHQGRRGVPEFHEPELAAALLEDRPGCVLRHAGEQYALGVLLYQLAAGHHYLESPGERSAMLRQIVEARPRSFAECGVAAWPALERVLGRALAKRPEQRYASTRDLLADLKGAKPPATGPAVGRRPSAEQQQARALFRELSGAGVRDFQLPDEVPHASVAYGAAGVAYALYTAAAVRRSPELLALAAAWADRADRAAGEEGAFERETPGLSTGGVGPGSLYFGMAGTQLVRGLIAAAWGEEGMLMAAVDRFAAQCVASAESVDLALGRAGLLVGSALLLRAVGNRPWQARLDLRARMVAAAQTISHDLWPDGAGELLPAGSDLGIAHGHAGPCYATMLWAEASQGTCPEAVHVRLHRLADLSQRCGRGVRWPMAAGLASSPEHFMESWCHGTPGYVYLFALAARVFRDHRFLELAEQAGWTAWEASGTNGTLCCGYAGRAYALLHLHRQTGDPEWRRRAERLAVRACEATAKNPPTRYALYKGMLGAAVLGEDLRDTGTASFPLFEPDLH